MYQETSKQSEQSVCSSELEILWRNMSVGWDNGFYHVLMLLSYHQLHNFLHSSISSLVLVGIINYLILFFFNPWIWIVGSIKTGYSPGQKT